MPARARSPRHQLPRAAVKRCAWCDTPFVPKGPNGGWPCCSKSCYQRLLASRALPRERDDEADADQGEASLFDREEVR